MVPWPSGKARVCKTLIPQFKSGRYLQKIKHFVTKCFIFIQSEGLACYCRKAYVISSLCELYVIKASALYASSFGLITYLSAKGLHTSLRDDYIPSATDYIQGSTLIVALRANELTFLACL